MSWTPIIIRNLSFLGPGKPTAALVFDSGLNVICGASDTGKSFIVEALDFLFGGNDPLRDIPERVGYDRARMAIETAQHGIFTLERSVEGGNYRLFKGLIGESDIGEEFTTLSAKHAHDRVDNLSGWLFYKIGLLGKRIRFNKKGETRSLSFRNLARLTIIQENEIIKQISPFLSGQFILKTIEYSALKLLLTGLDDSALVPVEQVSTQENIVAKIELIDQWIADYNVKIEDIGVDRKEIEAQLERLEEAIESQRESLQRMQKHLDESIAQRQDMFKKREEIRGRIDEINDLLARFNLLSQHYNVDLGRLSAIEESGSLFVHQERAPCPLCGAPPEEQHIDKTCGGDVNAIVVAARAEIEKVKRLYAELEQTMIDLKAELKELSGRLSDVEERYRTVDSYIREAISPDVGKVRITFSDLVENREKVKRIVDLFAQMDRLLEQKRELLEESSPTEHIAPPRTDLSKTVLEAFSQQIEKILKAWNFPTPNRIYFDEGTIDVVIDGKPRGSMGKGFRAITHAAVSIALMEYCRDRELPHPGFVVLDSPLLAYWAPEGEEDNLIGTDLKDRFYQYLAANHGDSQVIIIENEHPSGALLDSISFTNFTKNPNFGRYGFFPFE